MNRIVHANCPHIIELFKKIGEYHYINVWETVEVIAQTEK